MQLSTLFFALVVFGVVIYALGVRRSKTLAAPLGGPQHLNSLPFYYGLRAALWGFLPAVALLLIWLTIADSLIADHVLATLPAEFSTADESQRNLVLNQIQNVLNGALQSSDVAPEIVVAAEFMGQVKIAGQQLITIVLVTCMLLGSGYAMWRIRPQLRARESVEKLFEMGLLACSCIAIFTTLGIVLSVLFESIRFFQAVPPSEFLFGVEWSPQMALRPDQVGSSGSFGAVPLFLGTMLISLIALVIAVPTGLLSAVYLSEYAAPSVRAIGKPLLEVLAGIPTVVYGFFAALTVAPAVRDLGQSIGLSVTSESALAAGLVMGVMIIPFVSSLAEDVIGAVPQSLREGSLALGATQSETITRVIFPAALPGIVGGVLLAASRAIGETMIVVMAAGLAAKLTVNPLETVTTVTVQIVTLLVGDQEFDSPKTLAAFALGLMLFTVTLILNIIALRVVKKYREQYE